MPEILHLPADPQMEKLAEITMNVEFSPAQGLKCAILSPWYKPEGTSFPAIVFVQGSAWTFPNIGYEIPQLAWYAQHGYVVMTVTHRNREEGHPFPAFLQDVKCAIRYLRAHAEKYHVDKERIAIWGTSSGGNTSMLVHLTGDDPRYRTDEWAEESDAVCCAVECFGPSEMVSLFHYDGRRVPMLEQLRGELTIEELAKVMSPYYQIQEGKKYPPILMLHGNADPVVDYESQGVRMYERYLEYGVDAKMICIDGAPHEGPFWSTAVHEHVMAFLDEHLK